MATKSTLRLLTPHTPFLNNLKYLPMPRKYHSHDHPPPPGPFSASESLILSSAALHIPIHGFTQQTLSLGAKDAGYIDASVNLFPKGEFELVRWWLWSQRMQLAGRWAEVKGEKGEKVEDGTGGKGKEMGVGQKVEALTWERLMGNREVVGRWQEALALMALPHNVLPSLSELHALSDEIWYLSGDVSVDTSWYTRRASLSTIYAATELFMTTDKSMDFKDTREFMDRRFRDVQSLGSAVGGLTQWVGFTASAVVNVARSKGVRI